MTPDEKGGPLGPDPCRPKKVSRFPPLSHNNPPPDFVIFQVRRLYTMKKSFPPLEVSSRRSFILLRATRAPLDRRVRTPPLVYELITHLGFAPFFKICNVFDEHDNNARETPLEPPPSFVFFWPEEDSFCSALLPFTRSRWLHEKRAPLWFSRARRFPPPPNSRYQG